MKVTKRFLTILLSVCLIMSMFSMTAFAAGTGTITVKEQEDSYATLVGKTLKLFKIFNATKQGNNMAYQWITEANGTNRYESVFFGDDGLIKDKDGNDVLSGTIHDVVAYIDSIKNDSAEFSKLASALHDYIHSNGIVEDDKVENITATSHTFLDVSLGYYMVYDATDLTDAEYAVRSAAMLTHPGENKIIYLKADRPHIVKTVNDGDTNAPDWKPGTTASIGKVVTFKIETAVPNHEAYGDTYKFEITDVMDDTLELVENSISVNIGEQTEGYPNIAYRVITEENELGEADDFKVLITNIPLLESGAKITITYQATVKTNAKKLNTNTATLVYSNDPHDENSTGHVQSSAVVRLWQFILTKYMEDASGTPSYVRLKGAEFQIYEKTSTGLVGPLRFNIHTVKGEDVTKEYTVYTLHPTGAETILKTEDEGINGDDSQVDIGYETDGGHIGEILIWGLGEGTYVIQEIKAPDGYQIAKGDFEFTLSDTVGPNGAIANASITQATRTETPGQFNRVAVREAAQKYYIGITNRPGSALPETGGIGTTVYMVAGLAIMICAATILVYKKRNSAR